MEGSGSGIRKNKLTDADPAGPKHTDPSYPEHWQELIIFFLLHILFTIDFHTFKY
jgi:hypothetical protein